jgi:hypothetical protein
MKSTHYCLFVIALFSHLFSTAQDISYRGAWGPAGVTVENQDAGGIRLNFSVTGFSMQDMMVGNETLKKVMLPGHMLFNEPGAPDLPGKSYFVALPSEAEAELTLSGFETDTITGVDLIPAPVIPIDDDREPLVYSKNAAIYSRDAFYPERPVMITGKTTLRGVEVAVIGITPFQYNPVTRQLVVFRNMKADIGFSGGKGLFGEEKYRSRYWDPVLYDNILNSASLPRVSYDKKSQNGGRTFNGCEYLIITPDDEVFQQWADSIVKFRTEQGILTFAVTITEVGGNTATAIEAYINNAYNNWDIPPDACLLLGDYGADPLNSITSNVLNDHPSGYNPYVSDNLFADVTGNDQLPEIVFARITARNATELQRMVTKFLDFERTPPTSPDFYDHPITALGWQTERWFQICSEVVGGYFKYEHDKNPVRINAIYGGNPDVDPWSTASNTTTVVNYFGPSGQGYIPSTPQTLGGWTGGTAAMINNAINSGAFILQHRDHGYTLGWGEPAYSTSNVSSLTNADLTFVMSINCQTGKFDSGSECLAEKFHRHTYNGQGSGAVGVVAPTEVSYSFVNDVFTWGFYDNLFTDFMPDQSTNPPSRGLLPCFGTAAGKFHLQQSNWAPLSQTYKTITYKLFHFHGDAFTTLYSEVPQSLNVQHAATLLTNISNFTVTADSGAFIALTIDGQILATADATGDPIVLSIPGTQAPGDTMIVTVTMRNHFRHRSFVEVLPNDGPYLVLNGSPLINDSLDNDNGVLDYGEEPYLSLTLKNTGTISADNIVAELSSADPHVTIIDSVAAYGTIAPNALKTVPDGYRIGVGATLPDGYLIEFTLSITAGASEWVSNFNIAGHSPELDEIIVQVEEVFGNLNGIFDPGETAELSISVINSGTAAADSVFSFLSCPDPLICLLDSMAFYGTFDPGDTLTRSFTVVSDESMSPGTTITYAFQMEDDLGTQGNEPFSVLVGRTPAFVLDLDPNYSSGPSIQSALTANGIQATYATAFPADLGLYHSAFVCLGIYSTNHVLTTSEGQILADYLNNGGNLYMEGGDTWFYDPATAVHPFFRITGLSDGSADLATINGTTGTFTQGFSYPYTGAENYIDRLAAVSPAFVILANSSPAYNTCIAFDGGTYKTIGSSHEFSGLSDGTYTRAQLMRSYLDFFGLPVQAEWLGVNGNWHNASNWSNGMVPDQNTVTIIPATGTYPTQFTGGNATCKGIVVEAGVNMVIPAGTTLTIDQ